MTATAETPGAVGNSTTKEKPAIGYNMRDPITTGTTVTSGVPETVGNSAKV
jgi:hypothetical protein